MSDLIERLRVEADEATECANAATGLRVSAEEHICSEAADALGLATKEIDILREGLCDIAKTAIKAVDTTFEHMAVDTLRDANELRSQSAGDSAPESVELSPLGVCLHGISIHKPCITCCTRAVVSGEASNNTTRYFPAVPQTVEDSVDG